MLKTWAIFTDIHFFLSFLSKPPTPDFSQKDFSESHILFFLDGGFFLLLLRSAQEAAVHSSSVMNIYKGQYTGPRVLWWQWARQLHWAFADESLLLMVSYQLISASAVLQMPFFPNTDFSLELQETAIPQPRCVAFLRPVWLPLGGSRLAGAQEIWVLGEPSGLVNCGSTRMNTKPYLTKRATWWLLTYI